MNIIFYGGEPSESYWDFVKMIFDNCNNSKEIEVNNLYTVDKNKVDPHTVLTNLATTNHRYDGIVMPGYDAVTGDDITYVHKYIKNKSNNVISIHTDLYQWNENHWECTESEDTSPAALLVGAMQSYRRPTS